MLKWTKKDCVDAITKLQSPLENIAQGKSGLSPLTERIRGITDKFRKPRS